MTAKLTLSVDPHVIDAAKRYADRTGTSVSRLVERYLAALAEDDEAPEPPPVLARLRGTMREVDLEDYRQHTLEKYR